MADLSAACRAVLDEPDPIAKVKAARRAARDWRLGRLVWEFETPMPDRPARNARPPLLPPSRMPRRGRGGSTRGRIAMLHALAHIEYVAIDLAFDLVGRFGRAFPRAFADRWMQVGAEEAIHFALLERRLNAYCARYGDLPAHDGLWEAAEQTAGDALARLAIVPMVLEARGLDVTPSLIRRFESAGDEPTARILRRIAEDEINHVAAGVIWFESLCAEMRIDCVQTWQSQVSLHFRGAVKPPFNDSARARAGLTKEMMAGVAPSCDPSHNRQVADGGGNSRRRLTGPTGVRSDRYGLGVIMHFPGNYVLAALRLAAQSLSLTRMKLLAAALLLTSSVAPALAQEDQPSPNAQAAAQFQALFQSWKKLDAMDNGVISIPSIQPLANFTFTSAFGVRSDPFRGSAAMHAGIDLAAPSGTPIYATADGVVDRAEWYAGYGNMVDIDHGKGIATRYGHMSRIAARPGERIKRGELIGYVGSTGRSTGNHLHYEVRIDGHAVNPMPFLQSAGYLMAARNQTSDVALGGPED